MESQTSHNTSVSSASPSTSLDLGATKRFVAAATSLQQSVKHWQKDGADPPDFPKLVGEPERFDARFEETLSQVLNSRKTSKSGLSKCGDIMKGIFTALSPFAKNFLIVAQQGQSVPLL
jgi:hypothetical protein